MTKSHQQTPKWPKQTNPSQPLSGKTVLITRAADSNATFRQLLESLGAQVLEMPALEIIPPSSWQALDNNIQNLESFDWLIFTSANGVQYLFQRLDVLGKNIRQFSHLKIAVVGKKTAQFLSHYGISPHFVPPDFIADSLASHFPEQLQGKKILLPRVETGGRDLLVQQLTQKGATVVEVAAYQSVCPEKMDDTVWKAFVNKTIDVITFASSKTVRNFHQILSQTLQHHPHYNLPSLLQPVIIASIGPQTSATCREVLGRVDVEAKEYTLEGLAQSLTEFFQQS
ncbi:MAG: uroporphyrinogen-III synthase [Geminocystis sp.]|nr:uroporphyrinogen-III synthase [Geminocystis sp.]MDW8117299.1 uroporphyrinogen-III synthase [Geminocystis sp.]MDW8461993.1 uroporphyrinogen-III synthase [Geminocystis sp.]